MNIQILTFILANTITGTVLFKYLIDYLNKTTQDKLDFLSHKVNKLESELSELHETIDLLEECLHRKHNDMNQSHEQLGNKIDSFIVSNYDVTNKDI